MSSLWRLDMSYLQYRRLFLLEIPISVFFSFHHDYDNHLCANRPEGVTLFGFSSIPITPIGVRNKMLQLKIVGFKQGINYLLYIATVTLENPLVYCCALSKNTFVLFRNII